MTWTSPGRSSPPMLSTPSTLTPPTCANAAPTTSSRSRTTSTVRPANSTGCPGKRPPGSTVTTPAATIATSSVTCRSSLLTACSSRTPTRCCASSADAVVQRDHLRQIGAPQAWDAGFAGTGTTIAVPERDFSGSSGAGDPHGHGTPDGQAQAGLPERRPRPGHGGSRCPAASIRSARTGGQRRARPSRPLRRAPPTRARSASSSRASGPRARAGSTWRHSSAACTTRRCGRPRPSG
jgi:hypothetical protein